MKKQRSPILKVSGLMALALILTLLLAGGAQAAAADDLVITGLIDGPLTGGVPKAVELYAVNAIPDLSIYGIGLANNGGGSDGIEFTFPADSVAAGECIYVATTAESFNTFFGFDPDYISGTSSTSATNLNGDDAFELFTNSSVSDVFGDINTDGNGQPWEYVDGWAYRNSGTGPDGSTFVIGNWTFSGINVLDGETSNSTAATPFPIGTYAPCAVVDSPPTVSGTTPADGSINVDLDANIDISFSEDVTVTGSWFDITCAPSGAHTAVVSGGPQDFTLNPDVDFDDGDDCTVTIVAAEVADQDGTPDNLAADYVFSFTPAIPKIIINEISADPDATNGDANGDGDVDTSQDEFVEIVNATGSNLELGGWTLSDAVATRHTFPAGTVVPDNCSILVFGGGTPTGAFGNSIVQTATGGYLGFNNGGDTVILSDGVADQASYAYGSEGGDNQSLTRDPDVTGPAPLVKHTTATGSGGALFSPGTLVDGTPFAGCPTITKIHEVQGSGLASPIAGDTVVIEGIVVGDFQDDVGANGDLNGFFVQEEDSDADADPLTSEGIFVFQGSNPSLDLENGDRVRVEGAVSEFFDLTQITSFNGVSVVSKGNSLPSAAALSLPVTSLNDFEPSEGMRVTFAQALYISEYFNFDRFNETVLTPNRLFQPTAIHEPGSQAAADLGDLNDLSKITLDDGRTSQNPDPAIHPNGAEFTLDNRFRGGDTVEGVTGVLNYAFSLYRIQPTENPTAYTAANPRPATPDDVGGRIKVASLNVLNYFTTLDNGTDDICGPDADQECRGADNATELERQRAKIIAALLDIDADVFGLMEIQNSGTDEAVADLVAGLNDIAGAGTYDYIPTGFMGTDAIAQAFIYKTDSVSPLGAAAVLDDASFVNPMSYDEDKNRPALAQSFEENANGAVVTVVVNHLKSKGSGCGSPDDDPEQGSCNGTRAAAAAALATWLATDPTGSGDQDFLIIGDLNSYDKEDPIDVLTAAGYTDLAFVYGGENAYSYVFSGELGYLDYGMSNPALTPQVTGTTIWLINADEPDILDYDTSFKKAAQDALYEPNAFRASDHDPVIIGLELNRPPVCTAAYPTINSLWAPNHRMFPVEVLGVYDPDGDPFTINIDSIFQDEPVDGLGDGHTSPDGDGIGTAIAKIRMERAGKGNGRFYHITFTATDDHGNSCDNVVKVSVGKSQGRRLPVDDGPLYDSTVDVHKPKD